MDDVMVWTFWIGAGVIIAIDIVAAVLARRTFTRRARHFLMDVPVVAYMAAVVPLHIMWNQAIVGWTAGVAVMLGVGAAFLVWEWVQGAPAHPVVAFFVGLPVGMFFFPG